MIDLFRRIFDTTTTGTKIPDKEFRSLTSKFMAWVTIYGSDEAVKIFSRWMQATYHDPPATILLRLYAEFVLAARRDMGYPTTEVTEADFLAMRIKDLYHRDQTLYASLQRPIEDVARDEKWPIPWPIGDAQ